MDMVFYLDWHFWIEMSVAVGTIATALVSLKATRIAANSLGEVEKTRKDEHMPILTISSDEKLEPSGNSRARGTIKNIGRGVARNIRAEVRSGGANLQEVSVEGIESVPAGESSDVVLCYSPADNAEKDLFLFYQDVFGRPFISKMKLATDGSGLVIHKNVWEFIPWKSKKKYFKSEDKKSTEQ